MIARGVAVVLGTGAIGIACAQRLGPGHQIVLADYSAGRLADAATVLRGTGHVVETVEVDVSDAASVTALATRAGALGPVDAVVHTAGISPQQGTSEQVFRIDLLGAALVIDAFLIVCSRGTVMTVIASMGAYQDTFPAEVESALANTPTPELLALPCITLDSPDTRYAYHLSKRFVQLRVQTASFPWGRKGGRINSVSPGIIATPMSAFELAGPRGDMMRRLVTQSPAARIGTPDDIAAAVAFLSSPEADFITGCDLLIDGGAANVRRWPQASDSTDQGIAT